jgi:hypothetical protein
VKTHPLPFIAISVAVACLIVACGGHSSSSSNPLYPESVARMAKLELGMSEYINDYDDSTPLPNKWMDELTLYVKDSSAFQSPAVPSPGYGYALNVAVAGKVYTQFSNPDQLVAIFDSTNVAYNATESLQTLPNPARYGSKNTLGYADGRTQDNSPPVSTEKPIAVSLSNVKQLGLGLLLYENDWDEYSTPANAWMDDLGPYVKNSALFQSPAVAAANPNQYGYALNSAMAGINLQTLNSPSSTIAIFDSTVLTRNATAATTTLPNPGRYDGQNAVGFADGHARAEFPITGSFNLQLRP